MIGSGNTRFEHELKKRINEELNRLASVVATGEAVKDYAQYREYVGRVIALKLVIGEYCDDVNTVLNEE